MASEFREGFGDVGAYTSAYVGALRSHLGAQATHDTWLSPSI